MNVPFFSTISGRYVKGARSSAGARASARMLGVVQLRTVPATSRAAFAAEFLPGGDSRCRSFWRVGSTGEVVTEATRLKAQAFQLRHEDNVTCCYAVQDKFWIDGANNREWEIYTVLANAPESVQTPAQPTRT